MNRNLLDLSISESEPKITLVLPISNNILDVEKNRIIYKNLLKDIQQNLQTNYSKRNWNNLLIKLKEYETDITFFQGSGKGKILFIDSESNYIFDIMHSITPYVYVGNQFLLKDLYRVDEEYEHPKYLIEIGKDRFYSWRTDNYEQIELKDIDYIISNYLKDYDSKSNLNIGNYGGLEGKFHGHHTKDIEDAKSQMKYYIYLNEKFKELSRKEKTQIIFCGVHDVINQFLSVIRDRSYIFEILEFPISKHSKKELQDNINAVYEKKLKNEIKKIHLELSNAKQKGKVIHDLNDIKINLNKKLIKKLIILEKTNGYSIEHNQLIISCLKSNIKPIILKSEVDDEAVNAILY